MRGGPMGAAGGANDVTRGISVEGADRSESVRQTTGEDVSASNPNVRLMAALSTSPLPCGAGRLAVFLANFQRR